MSNLRGNFRLGVWLFAFGLLFAVLLVFNNEDMVTGYTTKDLGSRAFILHAKDVKIMNIEKDANSVLEVNIESDGFVNLDVKLDCDSNVVETIESVNGVYRIKEPTTEKNNIYKSENLCLVFRNTEIDELAYVNVILKQVDKDKWRIV